MITRNFIKNLMLPGYFWRILGGAILTLIIWGCGAVPQLKEGTEAIHVRLPFVRVLLENSAQEIEVASNGSFALECRRGGRNTVYYSSQSLTVTQDRGLLIVRTRKGMLGERFEEILVSPRGVRNFLEYNNRRYRGLFRIFPSGMNLRLVNIVYMEDYLKGVVPPEIGKVTEEDFEAIKAQAVAARTYSLRYLSQYPNEPYDLKSDVADQLYEGVEAEVPLISKAVEETRGYVIKFEDSLINAYYHSTCGGYTDDIDEVWDKPSAPYLRAVNDSGACQWSKYFRWQESFTSEQLKMRLEQYLSADRGKDIEIGEITGIEIVERTAGGRVFDILVKTDSRDYRFGKDRVRWVFKRASNPALILQSARFDVNPQYNSAGKLIGVDFEGGGYGHGVGMCQCGALGMARAGKKFDQILMTYYRHTKLVKLY